MKSIADLKRELRDAKFSRLMATPVAWSAGGSGMTRYDEKLAVVTRLTHQLNLALKAEGPA